MVHVCFISAKDVTVKAVTRWSLSLWVAAVGFSTCTHWLRSAFVLGIWSWNSLPSELRGIAVACIHL